MRICFAAVLVFSAACGVNVGVDARKMNAPGDSDSGETQHMVAVDDAGELPADAATAPGTDASEQAPSEDAGLADAGSGADAGEPLVDDGQDASAPFACAEPHGVWTSISIDGASTLTTGGKVLLALDLEKDFLGATDRREFDADSCVLSLYRRPTGGNQYQTYKLVVDRGTMTGTYTNKSVDSNGVVSEYTQDRVMVPGDAEHCHGTPIFCVATADWPTRP